MSVKVKPWKGQQDKFQVEVSFRWPDKSPFRERTVVAERTLAAARRWGEQRESIVRQQGKRAPVASASVPTFAEFMPRYLDKGRIDRKEGGWRTCERDLRVHVLPFLGPLPLDQITTEQVSILRKAWVRGGYPGGCGRPCKGTQNPKTHAGRLIHLRAVLNCAVTFKVIEKLSCKFDMPKFDKEAESHFYERETVDRLILAARELGPRYLVVLLLGCDAGLRLGEMIALRHDDLDYVRSRVHIRRSVFHCKDGSFESTTKGNKAKPVPMTPRLREALCSLDDDHGPRALWRDDGCEVHASQIQTWMGRIERRAGLPVTKRVHILRHTFITHLVEAGVPVLAVQELARHANLQCTLHYMHLAPTAGHQGIACLAAWQSAGGQNQSDASAP